MCSNTFGPAILPSLVIWPMSNTGTPWSLANFNKAAAHSRIWVTLPGELSTVSVCMVCTESMMSNSGLTVRTSSKMRSMRVSQRSSGEPPAGASGKRRSARNLIWRSLSSPLT